MSYTNEDDATWDTLSVRRRIDSPEQYSSGDQREPKEEESQKYTSSYIPEGSEVYQFNSR